MSITVLYTCRSCGIFMRQVLVLARTDEDVVYWTREVLGRAVGGDHAHYSPFCKAPTMSEVMIPMTGVDRIGGLPIN